MPHSDRNHQQPVLLSLAMLPTCLNTWPGPALLQGSLRPCVVFFHALTAASTFLSLDKISYLCPWDPTSLSSKFSVTWLP